MCIKEVRSRRIDLGTTLGKGASGGLNIKKRGQDEGEQEQEKRLLGAGMQSQFAKLTSRVNGGQNNLKDYPAYSNLSRADR